MFTVWHELFSLVLVFPSLRSSAPMYIQGKCIYTIFKAENQETEFPFDVLNLVWINISFHLSKVGGPEADLLAIRA